MRIGIVCYPTYGGSGVVATELARMLARRGHIIHIIASSRPFRLMDDFSENIFCHEIDLMNYPVLGDNMYTLAMAVKIMQTAIDERLDLIHVHYAVPHAISAQLAVDMLRDRGRMIPVITTLHGTDITLVGSHPSFRPVVRLGLERSAAVVAVSQWLRDETARHFNFAPDSMRVIYNFVDGEVFFRNEAFRARREHYALPEERVVMHLSNFRPVKRIADVIRAFARIAQQMPAKLLMIGDGPDRNTALQLARELDVIDRVWFLGRQEYAQRWLPLADLFLFPSDGESFGLAAAEAMACEVPVVACDKGGVREVVRPGISGFLHPVGDVESMAASSIALLADEPRRREMGAAARRDMLERFHPDNIVGQYEDLYGELLEGESFQPVHKCATNK